MGMKKPWAEGTQHDACVDGVLYQAHGAIAGRLVKASPQSSADADTSRILENGYGLSKGMPCYGGTLFVCVAWLPYGWVASGHRNRCLSR